MSADREWVSVASEAALVSLRAPLGWALDAGDPARLALRSDAVDADGYRASLTLAAGEPQRPGAEWFEAFCDAAPAALSAALDGFELLATHGYLLSSGAAVFAVGYRQDSDGLGRTSHLQAYVWAGSTRMFVIDAATLAANEARDLPVFEAVTRSLRILPERPA